MGIKRNVEIIAEVMGTKASRIAADAARQQAERLLREDARPVSTRKPKRGKQAAQGRVRVERARPAIVTAQRVLELQHLLAEMATREILEDERGHARFERNTRWGNPSVFVAGYTGFYTHIFAEYTPTVEGLMAFEDALFDGNVLPRGYVTPDDIVAVTGRQLGK